MGIWIRRPGAQGRGCVFRVIDLDELSLNMNERELAESRLLRDERPASGVGWGGGSAAVFQGAEPGQLCQRLMIEQVRQLCLYFGPGKREAEKK